MRPVAITTMVRDSKGHRRDGDSGLLLLQMGGRGCRGGVRLSDCATAAINCGLLECLLPS